MSKRLSIHMLVKNGARTIERAIEPFAGIADELVFTDTGSTDGTPRLIHYLGEKYNIETKEISVSKNNNPLFYFSLPTENNEDFKWYLFNWAGARNLSLSECTGRYIVKMDCDDQLISSKENVIKILNYLDANEQIDFVMCPYSIATFPSIEEVPIEYTTMYTRFWRNKPGIRFRENIHENVDWVRKPSNFVMTSDECLVVDRRDSLKERDPRRNFRILKADYEAQLNLSKEFSIPFHPSNHVLLYLLEESANLFEEKLALEVADNLLSRKGLSVSDLSLVWLYKGMALEKMIDENPQTLKDNFEAMEAYSLSASYGNGRGVLNVALMNQRLQIEGWREKLRSALQKCQTKLYPFGASNLEVYRAQKLLSEIAQ